MTLRDTSTQRYSFPDAGVRRLLVLSGDQQHCEALISRALDIRRLKHRGADAAPSNANQTVEQQVAGIDRASSSPPVPWVAEDLPAAAPLGLLQHVHVKKATQLLGADHACVVYVANRSFDANVFAALAGTVIGGGLFILLRSNASGQSAYDDYFSEIYSRFSARSKGAFLSLHCDDATTSDQLSTFFATESATISPAKHQELLSHRRDASFRASEDQNEFVSKTIASLRASRVNSDNSYCALLKAKRGRGKTTALALFLEQWLLDNPSEEVWFCAPSRRQAQPVFDFLRSKRSSPNLSTEQRLRFCSVDQLLDRLSRLEHSPAQAGQLIELPLVVVDEAASLSLALLKSLAQSCGRLVLATTTEGYEGSGRGFLLRFQQHLKRVFGTVEENYFDLPLRWSPDDQLEPFVDTVCGLNWRAPFQPMNPDFDEKTLAVEESSRLGSNADLDIVVKKVCFADLSSSLFSQQHLTEPKTIEHRALQRILQKQLYQLLIDSHYQTRPSDLQRLFDAKDQHLWVAVERDSVSDPSPDVVGQAPQIYGVLLALEEGDFDRKAALNPDFDKLLAESVARGERRPPGNLAAQKLSSYTCDTLWCRVPSLRVSRIVTTPMAQRRGVGSMLLKAMEANMASEFGAAFWSSSFGVNEGLLQFWQANGAELVFLGNKIDKASGEHTAIVVKPIGGNLATEQRGSNPIERCIAFAAALLPSESNHRADVAVNSTRGRPMVAERGALSAIQQLGRTQWIAALERLDHRRLKRLLLGTIDWDTAYPSFARFLYSQEQAVPDRSFKTRHGSPLCVSELADCLAQNRGDWKLAADTLGLSGRGELVEFARQCLVESGLFSSK